jgi:hypothetical protein
VKIKVKKEREMKVEAEDEDDDEREKSLKNESDFFVTTCKEKRKGVKEQWTGMVREVNS